MKESPIREELRDFRQEMRDFRKETGEGFRETRKEIRDHKHGQYVSWPVILPILAAFGFAVFQAF